METMAQLQDAGTRLKSDFQATVRMLSSLVEPRAGLTAPCPRRIAKLVRTVSGAMKLSADLQNELMFAALLGDLGKLGLPQALVGMPVASMDATQAAVFAAHPGAGEAYLMALPSLRNAGLLLGSLYENWDGSGTPAGPQQRQISQGSRLLRVVTDYEHLLAGAIEFTPLTPAQAFGWLRRHRSRLYDPDCLDALLQVMNQPVAVRVASVRLRPVDLRAGMTTAQDLLSTRGVLLLGQETVLTDLQVRQIRRLEEANGDGLWLEVKLDD
jgi:response regulator RpfG family c-di-GMP phosphodiesterase